MAFNTLRDLIDSFAARGEAPALVARADGTTWSYARLHQEIGRLAAGLRNEGLAKGTRIGLIAPNRPEWVVAALGTVASGAVLVPLDTMMPHEDLAHALSDSGCRHVFTTTGQVEAVRKSARQQIAVWLLDSAEDTEAGRGWRSLQADVAGPLSEMQPGDTALHFHTSGTTGLPKGVPLTHRNLASNVAGLLSEQLVDENHRACLPLPLFHVYPFTVGMLSPLAAGAAIILPKGLSGPEILDALQGGRATAMIGVPRLYDALLAALRRRASERSRVVGQALSAMITASAAVKKHTGHNLLGAVLAPVRRQIAPDLRLVASGGARLEPETAYGLEALGWEVLSGYGLTETSPILTVNPRGKARHETVGRTLQGVELRIAEPDPEAGGEAGEVVARGPGVFAGYYNAPEKTTEAFTEDGWFRTGDLGLLENGYLRLVGRSSSRIVLGGGKNVSPDDVEATYEEHPDIREIAVLERQGHLVALVVPAGKPEEGSHRLEQAMREAARKLPAYRRVSEYHTTRRSLPRTALGKLQRHKLAEMYDEAKSGREPRAEAELNPEEARLLESGAARRVWDILRERFPDRRVTMEASLQGDIGVDSIDWIDLSLEIQHKAGVGLTEGALAEVETVRDLVELVTGSTEAADTAPPPGILTAEQQKHIAPRSLVVRAIRRAGIALNRAVMRRFYSLTVRNPEALPRHGPFIITPNHASYLDPFVLAASLPQDLLDQTWWAGFAPITHGNSAVRLFSRIAGVFPVDPVTPASTLAYGRAIVERGAVLVWFPEGARSQMGELGPVMPGIGVLVDQTQAPVLPVCIEGTFQAWPPHRRWPRRAPVTITFGRLRTADSLAVGDPAEEHHKRIAAGLHRALAELIAASRSDC